MVEQVKDLIKEAENKLFLARKSNIAKDIIISLRDYAAIFKYYGKFTEAVKLLEEAISISQPIAGSAEYAYLIGNLGENYLRLGLYDKSDKCFLQQLKIAKELPDPHIEKLALGNLGTHYAKVKDPEQAIQYYELAIHLARSSGDYEYEALLTWGSALQKQALNLPKEAVEYAHKAINIFVKLKDPQAEVLLEQLKNFDTGILSKISNFSKNTFAYIKDAKLTKLTENERNKRLTICTTCEFHTGITCKICGCFTAVKSWLPYGHCPIRKWPND